MRRFISVVFLLLLCSYNGVHAEQMLVFDRHFTHVADGNDSKYMGFSIFALDEEVPYNWITPVNYVAGTAYFRLTVLSKPSEKPVYYQFCFTRNVGYGYQELCSSYEAIRTTGVHEWNEPLASWWEPEDERFHMDFNSPPYRLMVVIWGWIGSEYKILDDRWGYGSYLTPELIADVYPMEVRFQVVLVSEGGTFEGFPADVAVDNETPSRFTVFPACPNPFNASTMISYEIPAESNVNLGIYDVLGRKITSLVNERQSSGVHAAAWNGTDDNGMMAGNGVYFYRITAGEYVRHGRMLLMK